MNDDDILQYPAEESAAADGAEDSILVVEDEIIARTRLQTILSHRGSYRVTAVDSAAKALDALGCQVFHVVLLDIRLPDCHDFELASLIGSRLDTGLIIISALDDRQSRLEGLRCGADDYLCKPYQGEELLLKVARLVQRVRLIRADRSPRVRRLRFGDWVYDREARALYRADGRLMKLSGQERRLLALFLEHPGRVFSRQQLLDALHQDGQPEVFDRAVDSAVSRLRRRIEADPRSPRMLKTVYGEGYVFDGEVRQLES